MGLAKARHRKQKKRRMKGPKAAVAAVGPMHGQSPSLRSRKEETVVKPIVDESKIALAGMAMVAWCVLWLMAALRGIFGKLRLAKQRKKSKRASQLARPCF